MNKENKDDYLKELMDIANKFEEQYYKFMNDTKGESQLQIFLRAHLYIEHELLILLKKNLKYPEIIINKLRFSDIINLVFALGILPLEEMALFKMINKFRNFYAHRLEFTITDDELLILIDSFTPTLQEIYFSFLYSKNDESVTVRLQTALFTIWSYLIEKNIIPQHIIDQLECK